ncbi:hypothetical protein RB608_11190 [Nocardioides sp. LHD-245]|uniref:hypothetical protein n=1 Tax=Nocardioides sp. LHD-245 TaxID=3051387 RepID=UPI0027E0741B|nr:hypothetical protein [Nocardioides sp. LHD-245]
MQRDDPDYDDAAWQAIIDNYGERVELETAGEGDDADPGPAPEAADDPDEDRYDETYDDLNQFDEDRFVPAQAPPVPVPPPDRMLAWLGVFGAPAVLLVFLVLGLDMPSWLGWLLVAWFVGGFCYLVIRSPGPPRDPWDDGARV